MQSLWFPAPVVVLFRRLVNVVSTLSISQQYLLGKSGDAASLENKRSGWSAAYHSTPTRNSFDAANITEPFDRHPDYHLPNPRHHHAQPGDTIHRLIANPALYDPVRKPRHPIVLCHGLYGFDVRGPESFPMLRMHYWSNVLNILRRKVGADVIVTGVPGTGSVVSRSESMDKLLRHRAAGRAVNFMAHSMGGLDCRYLISHIQPTEYTPISLTTIGTPHRGSPFMDWCMEHLGLGRLREQEEVLSAVRDLASATAEVAPSPSSKKELDSRSSSSKISFSSLPSSFTTFLLSLLDSPAYSNLTSTYLNTVFNPATPDNPHVRYFSVAGRTSAMSVWHPLWLPKMVLDGFEEKEKEKGRLLHPTLPEHERWGNDGLVTVQSARWGEFLGVMEESDHWALRGARGLELELPSVSVPKLEGDGWSLGDWGKFVGAWKREETKAKGVGAAVSESHDPTKSKEQRKHDADETLKQAEKSASSMQIPGMEMADDVVRASTDKVSAVFDWLVEQVPAQHGGRSREDSGSDSALPRTRRSDLSSKADLERFYIALCRKLYDEGL